MGEAVKFRWVQGPDGKWFPAQIGPELFAVRIPGCQYIFGERDFTMGPRVENAPEKSKEGE